MVWTLLFELNLKKIMKKQITYLFIYLIFLTTLQGQIVQERLPGAEVDNPVAIMPPIPGI